MKHNLKGIFAPLTTPFESNKISLDKFKDNIRKYDSFDLSGYVILGSSGESVYLTDEESADLVRAARKTASPGKKIIAGTARESTKITLEFTNRMADLGAEAALVRTPSYFKSKMDQDALRTHYLMFADESKVPVIIYNIPRNTGISVDPQLIVELSKHPNIVGIKESTGNLALLGEVIPLLGPHFNYLIGSGSVLLFGLISGATGAIITLSNVAPALCAKIYRLFLERKWDEALQLQLALIPLNKAIIDTYGIPGVKYALDLLGFFGGPCRLPLRPLDEKGKKAMEGILTELNLLP